MSHPFKLGDLVVYAEHADESPAGFDRHFDPVYVDSGIPNRALLRVLEMLTSTIEDEHHFVKVGCVPRGEPLVRGPKHRGGIFSHDWWPVSLFRRADPAVHNLPERELFDLLPCPFCGSLDVVVAKRNPHNDHKVVWCRGCCAVEVGAGTPVAQHAVDLWNRRIG